MMRDLQPVGPGRTTLEVIIPSQSGLSPDKSKETATLCPLDWPSNYSLLRLWHTNGSLQHTEARLRRQSSHNHRFASWTCTIKGLLNVSFGSQRSSQPRLHSKLTYETPISRIEDYERKPLQLIWGHTKLPSLHCTSMLSTSNKYTQ